MAVVTFHNEHRSFDAVEGTNLREFMRRVGVQPYLPLDRVINCRGHNLCGTCAVEIVDGKGSMARGKEEEATLRGNFAIAHVVDKNIRLSCQTLINGDMVIKTHPRRPVDWPATKERFTIVGIAAFFFLAFMLTFAVMFLDMIKQL